MTKEQYIQRLTAELGGIGARERADILQYVSEYFEEAGDLQAQQDLGSPEKYARQLKADLVAQTPPVPRETVRVEDEGSVPVGTVAEERKSTSRIWILVLGILSLPVSLPLAFCLLVLLFMLGLVVLMLMLAVGMIFLAGLFSAAVLVWRLVTLLPSDPAGAVYVLGSVMVSAGLACLGLWGLNWFVKQGLPWCAARLSGLYRTLKGKVTHRA